MSMRDIARGAVGGAVKLARLPLDVAISLLPPSGDRARPGATVAVDRWEATLRELAGYALLDDELREDAVRRRLAADERARALRLRDAAQRHRGEADERLADRVEQAEEQRTAAEQRAEHQRREAERRRAARATAAAQAEKRRKGDSRRARAKVEQAVEEQADEARLEQLRAEAQALEERAAAISAEDEAQRLQEAAGAKKAARREQ